MIPPYNVQGKTNTLADALLCSNGANITEDNQEVALIPIAAFLNLFDANLDGLLEQWIIAAQHKQKELMKQ